MSAESARSFDINLQIIVDWESLNQWTQQQLKEIQSYGHQHGWAICHISEQQSRTLEPVLSVWQMTVDCQPGMKTLWVINGDLPIETVPFEKIPSAREAVLAFSRKYIRRAQALKRESLNFEEDKKKMQRMVKAAADLLVLYHEDNLWKP